MATTLIRSAEFVMAGHAGTATRLHAGIRPMSRGAARFTLPANAPRPAEALHEARKRVMAEMPGLDRSRRAVDEISPPTSRTA